MSCSRKRVQSNTAKLVIKSMHISRDSNQFRTREDHYKPQSTIATTSPILLVSKVSAYGLVMHARRAVHSLQNLWQWMGSEKETYHLEVAASGGALDEVGSGADVVDDRPLDPRDHQVSSFGVHLRRRTKCTQWESGNPPSQNRTHKSRRYCAAATEGSEPRWLTLSLIPSRRLKTMARWPPSTL